MRTALRLTVAGLATTGLMFAGMPAASSAIVVGEGMKGVKLGHKKKTVIRKLGEPTKIKKGTNDFGKFQVLKYRKGRLQINLTNKVVTSISTKGKNQRTAADIGVGSTRREVKHGVPGVVCESVAGLKTCHVGDFLPGEVVTDFRIHHRLVTQVIIGRVLD